jgi:ketosteroid isomerase-like protein
MLAREKIIGTIESMYRARVQGDCDTVCSYLAPGATYAMNGGANVPAAPNEEVEAAAALRGVIGTFHFDSAEMVEFIVDGNKAAVLIRARVKAGGEPLTTEYVSLWEFDEAGKVTRLRDFPDTAAAASLAPEPA